MKQVLIRYAVALVLLVVLGWQKSSAQIRLTGMVTDADTRTGLPSVSIWNKRSGMGTVSSESGRYYIEALPGDTIEFSMLSYVRTQITAPGISGTRNVEMKRQIFGLQGVNIRGRIYKNDSMAIRDEYEKYFGYKRPGALDVLKTLPSNPITALSYLIPSKARKRKEAFGEQLKYWEEEKHIDYRYNPELVQRMTKLESPELDSFMLHYRPSYNFLLSASDYDLMLFIKQAFEKYQKQQGILPKDTTPSQ
ncbi:carboxypeptidase-like regulatory domain-containing protein [Chitinophaga sp. GCM10012297]|uniref:Carboxypeptidase-like regulatory domain-containing protein n=1 Tax=Chitinophaga chungangae TaxID=2821488 RepID=A0ABS3YCZ8_9BACT|nr:carboxypeptidase-like regulatory domain-containing protein [Chitinophaga chungangae]MBO9152562.1 carboxypeptidase-like regulatory domain-containing protein [Chitinophaga chungangae]